MSSYTTPDAKKEEFRKYLEKTGIIEHLTKALVALYEEADRPVNGLEYLRQYLDSSSSSSGPSTSTTSPELESLKTENESLKKQNDDLLRELEQLKVSE
ncbi:hypothetical protein GEMRC1_003934 [Eukaryota sp. GEM-RC1]